MFIDDEVLCGEPGASFVKAFRIHLGWWPKEMSHRKWIWEFVPKARRVFVKSGCCPSSCGTQDISLPHVPPSMGDPLCQNPSGAPLEHFLDFQTLSCIICCLLPLPFSLSQSYRNKFIASFRCHWMLLCLSGMLQLVSMHHCCVRAAHKYSLFPLF